jgi:RNA polymerase sigma-70 factor (ECF subfamily)
MAQPTDNSTSAAVASAREEDTQLVERCRRGDRQAFRALVERYQRKVYSLALGIIRDPDEARDISQEAFLKVFRHLDTFQGTASFYTWVYRITVNLCIDLRRKAGRNQGARMEFDERIEHDEVGSPADQLSPRRLGFDPMRALHNSELRKHILSALDHLSDQHRTVLMLREVDGLSYKEIADVMETPEGTVMSRLFHARRQMQELLREYVDLENKEAANAGLG